MTPEPRVLWTSPDGTRRVYLEPQGAAVDAWHEYTHSTRNPLYPKTDAAEFSPCIVSLAAEVDALAARVRGLEDFVREYLAGYPDDWDGQEQRKARALLAGDGKP